jgi:starch-binding outer membrane protein, SusD/RagB family
MKKIYLSVVLLFFVFVSCLLSCKKNFLGPTSITNLNQTTVFADSTNTVAFLANIYSRIAISDGANPFGNGGLDAAGDEGGPGNLLPSQATYWASGIINAANVTDSVYKICYTQIRAVNQLFVNISKTKLTLPDNQPGSRAQIKAEARFLRAWYYAILIKHYGGVPLVGDALYNYSDPIPVKRANYADCVTYITTQLDSAAAVLPYLQLGPSYGRASGGACQALKARVLLYAASPLFNGTTQVADAGGSLDPAIVGYPAADPHRWVLAKNAAYQVLATGAYQLNVDSSNKSRPGLGFVGLFCERYNQEYILQLMLSNIDYGNQLENFWDPPTRDGANGAQPYQEVVDVFPMIDGKDTLTSSFHYDNQNPYANRDPRLGYTVIHDQTVLPVRLSPPNRSPVNIFLTKRADGSIDNNDSGPDAVTFGTQTGYYVNKMLDTSSCSTDARQPTRRCQPLMRYAEVLLNYAEAYNESIGTDSAYVVLKAIRARAGILAGSDGMYGLTPSMSQSQMRVAIQNERRLELAFEGFRYWDVRRWKIATTEENKFFHGMKVIRVNGTPTYNIFTITTKHSFSARMNLWPIPQSEIGKSKDLVQNPGY